MLQPEIGASRAHPLALQFDRAASSHVRANILLVLVALLAFLPGFFTIPPVDRDEARYAQATRQMMQSGNYLDIRFQEEPRYLQPVGIYWLQVTAAKLTGSGTEAPIWVHRLPSLVGATAGVVLTYWAVLPIAGAAGAMIAALFMAASILLGVEARLAKTDAVLFACIVGAMAILARAYLKRPLALPGAMLFWLALALGFLVKGPLILLVVGATVTALCVWDRSAGWLKALRPKPGVLLFLLLVLPWFIAIAAISGLEFFIIAIGKSLLGKVAAGQQGHGAPPGTYLALFWVTFWPASVFALIAAPWVWQNRQDRAVRFCLAWIVPTWLVFELIVTKLPHYVLPVYPAIAALMALALLAGRPLGKRLGYLFLFGATLYAVAGPVLLFWLERKLAPGALVVSLVALAMIAWGVRHEQSLTPPAFAAMIGIAAIMINAATFGLVLPKIEGLSLSHRLADAVRRQAPCAGPQVVSAGYHQPSVVFAVGTRTGLVTPVEAANALAQGGCRIALVNARVEPEFIARLAELNLRATPRERVTGINIGRVGREDIGIYVAVQP